MANSRDLYGFEQDSSIERPGFLFHPGRLVLPDRIIASKNSRSLKSICSFSGRRFQPDTDRFFLFTGSFFHQRIYFFPFFFVSIYKANKQEISLTEKRFYQKVSTRHHALGICPSFFLIYRQISKIFSRQSDFLSTTFSRLADNCRQTSISKRILAGKPVKENNLLKLHARL